MNKDTGVAKYHISLTRIADDMEVNMAADSPLDLLEVMEAVTKSVLELDAQDFRKVTVEKIV